MYARRLTFSINFYNLLIFTLYKHDIIILTISLNMPKKKFFGVFVCFSFVVLSVLYVFSNILIFSFLP